MTRFRKWLIHKLGGVLKEEKNIKEPPLIKEEEINLVPLYAYYNLNEYLMRNFPEEKIKEIVEEDLIRKLSKGIKPKFILEDSPIGGKIFKAKIELPSKYIKGVEDDVNYTR